MARIENLIDEIPDSRVRAEIADEVKRLKLQMKFGLVFEQHLPELVRLFGFPIQPGALVARRGAPGSDLWQVRSIRGRRVWCVRQNGESSVTEREFSPQELVAVKRFGEAVYPDFVIVRR